MRATDAVAPEGPNLTWRTESTHREDLRAGTTIYKSSQRQQGEIPATSLLLGKKCPLKHYFISGYSRKLDIALWALLMSGGSKPLLKASAQVLHRGSSSLAPAPAHSAPFPPSKSFNVLFFLPILQNLTSSLTTPAYLLTPGPPDS